MGHTELLVKNNQLCRAIVWRVGDKLMFTGMELA